MTVFQMGFPGGIDLSTFQSDHKETSIWDVENITANKVLMDAGHNRTFSVLTFEIQLKRKLAFSSYMLTMPPVFLACITLVVFWLPPERPDRTALGKSGVQNGTRTGQKQDPVEKVITINGVCSKTRHSKKCCIEATKTPL